MAQFDAAWEGDLAWVQQLVTKDNVDEGDDVSDGVTVLHYACQEGHFDMATWLVGVGANVNARSDDGGTPLHLASVNSRPRCVQLLLASGADAALPDKEMFLPLHDAITSTECCELLIAAHPAGVNAVDTDGRTPLHRACAIHGAINGELAVARLLLDAGSVVDAVDSDGRTPLYFALRDGKRDIAELLLDRGAQLGRVKVGEDEFDAWKVVKDEFDEWNNPVLTPFPDWAESFVACRNACRASCWAMMELARRRSRAIGGNNRDVLRLIARMVWDSRREELWN